MLDDWHQKEVKSDCLDFKGQFLWCLKWWSGSFFGPKSTFDFLLNLLLRFFWNYAWWQTMSWGKWLLWIFNEAHILLKVNATLCGPKISKICSSVFWEILCDDRHSKGSRIDFSEQLWLWSANSYDIFGYKICVSHISCSTAFFFPLI